MAVDLGKARNLMIEKKLDVMLVNSAENFIYTSGIYDKCMYMEMAGQLLPQFVVLPVESDPVLLVNNGVLENAQEMSWIKDVRTTPTGVWLVRERKHSNFAESAVEGVVKVLEERKFTRGRIGIEKRYMPVDVYEQLRNKLPKAQYVDNKDILQSLRAIKTSEELQRIRKSTEIDEIGYKAAMDSIKEGASDFEIINEYKAAVAQAGGDISHMNYGVGPKAGTMFKQPYGRKAQKGDIVCLDLGAAYMGYRSDLCRMAVIGEPSERLTKLYRILLEAEREGIKAIRPGVKLRDIYEIVREIIRGAGYASYTRGMLGHSIGLENEEEPMIRVTTDAVFEPNMVFCIEDPWYEPGWGSVSVEDTVIVTENGCEEISTIPRELRVC